MLAEGVAFDQTSGGRVTVFNALDFVIVQKFPAKMPKLIVVSTYAIGKDAELFTERLTITSPSGKVVVDTALHVSIVGRMVGSPQTTHKVIHPLWHVEFDVMGDYRVQVQHAPMGSTTWVESASWNIAAIAGQYEFFPRPNSKPG
jgi:hypothetical protein